MNIKRCRNCSSRRARPSLATRRISRGPWVGLPSYQSEAHVYAKYLIEHHPNGKIGVLYQNDDYGKDYLRGMKDGLGWKYSDRIGAGLRGD